MRQTSGFINKRKGMGYMYQYYEGFGVNSNTQLVIEDPENWGWSVAFVDAGTSVIIPVKQEQFSLNVLRVSAFTQSIQIK